MSDDTTTPETPTTTTPENVIPFAPEASSDAGQTQQPASDATSTPAAEQPAEQQQPKVANIQDAVAHVVSQIDVNTVSHHDVIHDLFQSSQEYAFKLLLAAKLFEQMFIRDAVGLKGHVYDLLRHADEAVVNEVHSILKEKVTVPAAPVAPAAETGDQAVS
jgi:hypothetical protein